MQKHHSLLGIALVIFLVWLFIVVIGHVVTFFIHLLWILIIIAVIWWLVVHLGKRRRQQW